MNRLLTSKAGMGTVVFVKQLFFYIFNHSRRLKSFVFLKQMFSHLLTFSLCEETTGSEHENICFQQTFDFDSLLFQQTFESVWFAATHQQTQ